MDLPSKEEQNSSSTRFVLLLSVGVFLAVCVLFALSVATHIAARKAPEVPIDPSANPISVQPGELGPAGKNAEAASPRNAGDVTVSRDLDGTQGRAARNTDPVDVPSVRPAQISTGQFSWTYKAAGIGDYSFTIRNESVNSICQVECLIKFRDPDGNLIDSDALTLGEYIQAGSAKRVTGKVDGSVQELVGTTPHANQVELSVVNCVIIVDPQDPTTWYDLRGRRVKHAVPFTDEPLLFFEEE